MKIGNYCSLLFYCPQNSVYDVFAAEFYFVITTSFQNPLGTLTSSRTCQPLFLCDFWNASNNFHITRSHIARLFFHTFLTAHIKPDPSEISSLHIFFHFIIFTSKQILRIFISNLHWSCLLVTSNIFGFKFLCFRCENISDQNFLIILCVLSGFRRELCFRTQPPQKLAAPRKLIRVLQLNFRDTLNLRQKLAHNSFLFGSLVWMAKHNFRSLLCPLKIIFMNFSKLFFKLTSLDKKLVNYRKTTCREKTVSTLATPTTDSFSLLRFKAPAISILSLPKGGVDWWQMFLLFRLWQSSDKSTFIIKQIALACHILYVHTHQQRLLLEWRKHSGRHKQKEEH